MLDPGRRRELLTYGTQWSALSSLSSWLGDWKRFGFEKKLFELIVFVMIALKRCLMTDSASTLCSSLEQLTGNNSKKA